MAHILTILAQSGSTPAGGASPLVSLLPMALVFGIFYVIVILPMRRKQKKLETLVQALKPGDAIILNPGILGTVVGTDGEALVVKIDDKTKIRVLRSAVAGLQGPPQDQEKK
jgi:preprotein translocase subunit YajC